MLAHFSLGASRMVPEDQRPQWSCASPCLWIPEGLSWKDKWLHLPLVCPTGKTFSCVINWQQGASADKTPIRKYTQLTCCLIPSKHSTERNNFRKDVKDDIHSLLDPELQWGWSSLQCLVLPVQEVLVMKCKCLLDASRPVQVLIHRPGPWRHLSVSALQVKAIS